MGEYLYRTPQQSAEIHLYLGDNKRLIPSNYVSGKTLICVTDPPFNVGYKYDTYKDRRPKEDYFNMLASMVSSGPCVIVHYPEALHTVSIKSGVSPQRVVSWVYPSNTKRQHRDIAFYNVNPDFSRAWQPYKNPNDKRIRQLLERGKPGSALYDWWEVNQIKNVSKEKQKHPCQMPLSVMKNIVSILPDDAVIFDPFMGSGTTALACAELGVDFIGCEISREYYSICVSRVKAVASAKVIEI